MISMRMEPSYLLNLLDSRCRRVAGVWGTMGFDQQQVGLLLGNRPMLDAFWHDVEIAGTQSHLAIPELNDKVSLENEEKIVGFRMRMPDKLAFDFDDHHIMPVELGDDLWRPVL